MPKVVREHFSVASPGNCFPRVLSFYLSLRSAITGSAVAIGFDCKHYAVRPVATPFLEYTEFAVHVSVRCFFTPNDVA